MSTPGRRSGLTIRFESQRYQVVDLLPEQVDALAFRQLWDRVRKLGAAAHDDTMRTEIIALCRRAFELWVEDPTEAHPYVYDKRIFDGFGRRYAAMKAAYTRAVLEQEEVDRSGLAEASETIEELRLLDCDPSELKDLSERLARKSAIAVGRGPVRAQPPATIVETGADEASWLGEYRRYLSNLVEFIDLRPFGSEVLSESSLDTAYVQLHVKPRSSEKPLAEGRPQASRTTLDDVAKEAPRLLLVGESGSGKSTFLRHLCHRVLSEQPATVPLFLELVETSDAAERELVTGDRLPRDLLARVFVDHLISEGIPATVEDVDRLTGTGRALWLLDGLNEISAAEVRLAVAEVISHNARRWRDSRYVVTSTEAALTAHGIPRGLLRVDIDGLRAEDVGKFLEAFAADFYPGLSGEERVERWEPLVAKVLAAPDLRDLARLPLHLAAIAVIYFTEGWLPESRADLLQAAVAWSVRKRASVLRPYVRRGRELEQIFAELALQMVLGGEQPLAKVGRRWAAERIAKLPLPSVSGDLERSSDFLDAATASGGLLESRPPGDLGMHEAFRDYLAASRIAGKTDDRQSGWWKILEPHLDAPSWQRILTLVPGCLLALGSDRVDLFFDRLGESCRDQPDGIRAARIALGGSVLQELALAGYRLGKVPHWHEAVKGMREYLFSAHLGGPPEVRYQAAVAYGLTGDDRLTDFGATWASLPGGQYRMGAQSDDPAGENYDPDAAPWESPVRLVTVEPFTIGRYPVTVQEYRPFVEAVVWREERKVGIPLEWEDQLLVPNAPVTGVSWLECDAYCRWLTEQIEGDVVFRLAHEYEWEYAARRAVEPGMQFAWGNGMHTGADAEANWFGAFLRRKTPVGLFPRSTTPDGITDLFGNVEEWCQDVWELPEDAALGQEESGTRLIRGTVERSAARRGGPGTRRVVRGGSCVRFSRLCRPSYRSRALQHRQYRTIGFRMVALPAPSAGAGALRTLGGP